MKCRQIHLGCLRNLFVGAEWLPNDRSSLSLKHVAHGNLRIWLIRHFKDLWLSICWDENKERQLRTDPKECCEVSYWGFVVKKSFQRPKIHRFWQQTVPGDPRASGSLVKIHTCARIKSSMNTAISCDWNIWLETAKIFSVAHTPKIIFAVVPLLLAPDSS